MITIPDDNSDEFQNKKNKSIDDKNINSNRILSNVNIINIILFI